MGSFNRAIVVGHLGKDPEVRVTPTGRQVANFTVATNETWVDNNGNRSDHTEWHRIVAWGKQAELAGDYLKKGRQVCIEGRLQTRNWDDKTGVKHSTTEIVASRITFLDRRDDRLLEAA
jgi:single-strand DNA-binding protein